MTDRGEHMGKANGNGHGTSDGDDDPTEAGYVRTLAILSVQVRDNHAATIDGIDRVGGKVADVERGVKALGSHVVDLESRIMVEFSKLHARDTDARREMTSITNEVTETRKALSGLQVVGIWLDRNKRWGAFLGFVVVVVLQILHLFK